MHDSTTPLPPILDRDPDALSPWRSRWSVPISASAGGSFSISLRRIAGGLESPTQVTNAGDGTDRLFVVEQRGTIRVVQNGALKPGYFMDIRSRSRTAASAASWAWPSTRTSRRTGRLFVYYTRNGGDIVVSRYTTNASRHQRRREQRKTAAAHRAQRRDQPQRRRPGLRADRLAVRRGRRRRRRRRPGQRRPERRRRPSSARSCGST